MVSLITLLMYVMFALIFVKAFSSNRKRDVVRVKAPASCRQRSRLR